MRNLDSWVTRLASSAPAIVEHDHATTSNTRWRGFRSANHYRPEELIEEVRKNRVLWSRTARGFYTPTARRAAYKKVANAMSRRFPELNLWHHLEVQHHFRLLVQYHYAYLTEHGPDGKPHSFTCRSEHMSFMNYDLTNLVDCRTFMDHL